MTKKINVRMDENLYNKLKKCEHDFGAIGTSEAVRRLIMVAFHLTDQMEINDKLLLAIKVMIEGNKEVNS